MLARVLKDGLTDAAQIPVREWVGLDTERRQAIETRLDHNARGTEPEPNPDLVDELATEMTQAPGTFARRDLVPAIAHLPLPQWQRFRDWQSGTRRNDPATEDQLYAIKRGLQLADKMLPADTPDDDATNTRAELVAEIDTWRRVNGKSPADADITDMFARHVPSKADTLRTLEWDPRNRTEATPARFVFPRPGQGDRPDIHRVQDANRAMSPSAAMLKQMRELMAITQRAVIAAERAHAAAKARLAAAQAIPGASVAAGSAAARALADAMRALEETAREHAAAVGFDEYVREQMRAWSYPYAGQRFTRILEKNEVAEAARLGFVPTDDAPIDAQGRQVFVNPQTGEYIVRAEDVRTPGVWERLDSDLNWLGFHDQTLKQHYPDPPRNADFRRARSSDDIEGLSDLADQLTQILESKALTPEQKQAQIKAVQKKMAAAMRAGGAEPPPGWEEPPDDDEEKSTKPDPGMGYSESPHPWWKFGSHKSPTKWTNQMIKRGWTRQDITDAMTKGKRYSAPNSVRPGNRAIRYEHPTSGKSVIVDMVTREVLQIEGSNWLR